MADLLGRVLRGTIGREWTGVKEGLKDGAQGALGQATNGILGDPRGAQQQDPSRPGARPMSAGPVSVGGVSPATQGFLNRFGGGAQQAPGLLETVTGAPARLLGAILPSAPTVDRLKGGAAALGATADRIGVAGQEAVETARRAVSKPTIEDLNKRAEKGEISHADIQKMINNGQVQLPDASTIERQNPERIPSDRPGEFTSVRVEDRSIRAQPQVAEPAQPSLLEQGKNWFNSKIAAGATALAVATAGPAAAITEAPPAAPTPVTAAAEAQTFPVTMSTARSLDAPAVKTDIKPTQEFASVAAPTAAPAEAPAAAQRFANSDPSIYERAMAAVNAPKPGGMG